jgi:CRISPR system Cascade subunit CasB
VTERESKGDVAARWWRERLADRESGAARGLMARLRRADALGVLAEPAVQDLARNVALRPAQAETLVRLARVLAEVREDDARSLARRLGGAEPVMSPLRFQRLLRAEGEEAAAALRRAVIMAERRCNVARLAADLLVWDHPDRGEAARRRWIFDYFAAPGPEAEGGADKPAEETHA